MAFELTNSALAATSGVNVEPQIVLKIDGVDTVYGAVEITDVIRVGDPGLLIGDDWVIGGSAPVDDQADYISLDGTTTSIRHQLNQDTGIGTSISSMTVCLIDKNGEITELITPGEVVEDILGRKAKIFLGFQGTNYPDDYITVFRGIIDSIESEAGRVKLNISHPDQKKRQQIFNKIETKLNGAINNSVTTITVDSTTNFLTPVNGPSGANDTSLKFYIRIDNEIIRYTGVTATTFTGCTRGQLGTTAAAHDDDSTVNSFYRLTGNAIDLSLKLMLSGWNGYFATAVAVDNFNWISASETVSNSIFFQGVDLEDEYGLVSGDYVTTTGASNGANNVTLKSIASVNVTDSGTYIVINGVTFVNEDDSAATISFRSQYDTLGEGLKLSPDEVDVAEHLRIQRLFLSSSDHYDFYLKDTINGKEFIEKEVYNPLAAYSLPRKARASVGYHIGPIPGGNTTKLSQDNVTNAKNISLKRSTGKNMYNTVVIKFEEDELEDKFLDGILSTDATSKARIPIGNKTLTLQASGFRSASSGTTYANTSATRRLNRYKYGANYIDSLEVMFKVGFSIEIGDIVLLDAEGLFLSNTVSGDRTSENIRLYEVTNKELDIKTGRIRLSLVDTNFSTQNRYGLISPASRIKTGISTTQFVIQESFSSIFGADEYRKWTRFLEPGVRVRNASYSNNSTTVITGIVGNTITVSPALSFTPAAGDILEFASYSNCTTEQKLVYAFMRDSAFGDGGAQYKQL